ncbi:hypothetical protein SIO17_05140 [Pseudoalteromonas piscicida]|uniref:Uncharacterized protein n=2 Tax=Pseudoalteromonas piscicida TaxID=43662 RepID=A0ABN5C9V9_PSEO7|nr:hypothetical protein [Pseudoalteromonas piscicida]ATD06392.1 hypothetical protein PPIS_a1238 [Pseudoalteromonas piscicida]WPU33117.1 hypothetical protein SIO17_05140 [Pseudoalteromonas piscicida]
MSDFTVPDLTNLETAHRELVFEGLANDQEKVSLMVADTNPDLGTSGYYKIPLGTSSANDTAQDAEVELVHIYPLRMGIEGEDQLREGFIYIYVDGHLWRELEVLPRENGEGVAFKDVNLAFQKGHRVIRVAEYSYKKDNYGKECSVDNTELALEMVDKGERKATTEELSTIIVPNRLYGQQCSVEIAYSETQWSWKQIEAFGGMAETDPRLNYGPSVKPGLNGEKATNRRANRMQKLDKLASFKRGYDNSTLPDHLVLPVPDMSGVYVPVLADSLGLARDTSARVAIYRKELLSLPVTSIQQDPEFKSESNTERFEPSPNQLAKHSLATAIQSTFFHYPKGIEKKKALGVEVDEDAEDLAQQYQEYIEDSFSTTEFRKYLHTDRAFELGLQINQSKAKLFEIMSDEQKNNSFYYSIEDYAYYDDIRRCLLYAVCSDVLGPIKDLTITLISHFAVSDDDFKKLDELDANDVGQECWLKAMGTHPTERLRLIELLYPKKIKDEMTAYECRLKGSNDEFDTRFDLTLMQDNLQPMHDQDASFTDAVIQVLRRASQAMWGFLVIGLEVPTGLNAAQGQDIKSVYGDRKAKAETLALDTNALKDEKVALERSIEAKQAEINAYIKARNQILNAAVAGGMNPDSVVAQLDLQIKRQEQALRDIKKTASNVQYQLTNAKRELSALSSSIEYAKSARFENSVRGDLFGRFKQLVDVSTNGLIKEINLSIADYLDGNLPDGFLPLDFQSKAERASKRLSELEKAAEAFADSHQKTPVAHPYVRTELGGGQIVQQQLDHILSLDGTLGEIEKTLERQKIKAEFAQKRLQQKVLVLDASRIDALESNKESANFKRKSVSRLIDLNIWKQESILKEVDSLGRLSKFAVKPRTYNIALNGALSFVAALEAVNLFDTMKNASASGLTKASAILDFADIMINIGANVVEKKAGLPTPRQVNAILKNSASHVSGMVVLRGVLVFTANAVSLLAAVVSAYVAFKDAMLEKESGDTALYYANMTMMVGFLSLTASASLVAATHLISALSVGAVATFGAIASALGLLGLLIILIGAGLLLIFHESEIEAWLNACPWSKNRQQKYIDDSNKCSAVRASTWQHKMENALTDFYSMLYSPAINIQRFLSVFKVQISAPLTNELEGFSARFYWSKEGDDKIQEINHHQLAKLSSGWKLYPNRTGYYFEFTEGRLCELLNLEVGSSIELIIEVESYPNGKGKKVIESATELYSLPTVVTKKDDGYLIANGVRYIKKLSRLNQKFRFPERPPIR